MGKLNKMEITAIAETIVAEIKKNTKEYSEEAQFNYWLEGFREIPEYFELLSISNSVDSINRKLSGYKTLNYRGDYSYDINIDFKMDDILKWIFKVRDKQFEKSTIPSIEEIERELIVAQAKNESIDAMIQSITDKYTVKE